MTATEVKAKILALLDDVANGEEVEITKHGRKVARLIPARGRASLHGSMQGVAATTAPDEEMFSTGLDWHMD